MLGDRRLAQWRAHATSSPTGRSSCTRRSRICRGSPRPGPRMWLSHSQYSPIVYNCQGIFSWPALAASRRSGGRVGGGCSPGRQGRQQLVVASVTRATGSLEGLLGLGRGRLDATDLADILAGRRLDLLWRGRGLEPAQRGDVPAHGATLRRALPTLPLVRPRARSPGQCPWRHRTVTPCPDLALSTSSRSLPGARRHLGPRTSGAVARGSGAGRHEDTVGAWTRWSGRSQWKTPVDGEKSMRCGHRRPPPDTLGEHARRRAQPAVGHDQRFVASSRSGRRSTSRPNRSSRPAASICAGCSASSGASLVAPNSLTNQAGPAGWARRGHVVRSSARPAASASRASSPEVGRIAGHRCARGSRCGC